MFNSTSRGIIIRDMNKAKITIAIGDELILLSGLNTYIRGIVENYNDYEAFVLLKRECEPEWIDRNLIVVNLTTTTNDINDMSNI